jgi:hypothetical protein
MSRTWTKDLTIAGFLVLAPMVACGPRSSEDFVAACQEGEVDEVQEAWLGGDDLLRVEAVNGILAAAPSDCTGFLVEQVLLAPGAPSGPRLTAKQRLGTLDEDDVALHLTSRMGDLDSEREGWALDILEGCCQRTLHTAALAQLDGLAEHATAWDDEFIVTRLTAYQARAHRLSPRAHQGVVEAEVGALTELLRARTDDERACNLVGQLSVLGLEGLPVAMSAVYPDLRSRCGTISARPESIGSFLDAYIRMLPAAERGRFEAAKEAHSAWVGPASEVAKVESAVSQMERWIEESESAISDFEKALDTLKQQEGAYWLSGYIVSQQGSTVYEVQPLGWDSWYGTHYPKGRHVVLRTRGTEFTSTGRFGMWVKSAGTTTVTTTAGFVEQWSVVEEHVLIAAAQHDIKVAKETRAERISQRAEVRRTLWSAKQSASSATSSLKRALARLPARVSSGQSAQSNNTQPVPRAAQQQGGAGRGDARTRASANATLGEISVGRVVVSGGNQSRIAANLERQLGPLRSCYSDLLASRRGVAGAVEISWTCHDGQVSRAEVLSNNTGEVDLTFCAVRWANDLLFGSGTPDGTEVSASLRFSPE